MVIPMAPSDMRCGAKERESAPLSFLQNAFPHVLCWTTCTAALLRALAFILPRLGCFNVLWARRAKKEKLVLDQGVKL